MCLMHGTRRDYIPPPTSSRHNPCRANGSIHHLTYHPGYHHPSTWTNTTNITSLCVFFAKRFVLSYKRHQRECVNLIHQEISTGSRSVVCVQVYVRMVLPLQILDDQPNRLHGEECVFNVRQVSDTALKKSICLTLSLTPAG